MEHLPQSTAREGDETVQLTVFNPAFLLSPGTWYLAVVNRESVPVSYSVVVNARSTNLNYLQLSSGVLTRIKLSRPAPPGSTGSMFHPEPFRRS
jgi:hypothetical protein